MWLLTDFSSHGLLLEGLNSSLTLGWRPCSVHCHMDFTMGSSTWYKYHNIKYVIVELNICSWGVTITPKSWSYHHHSWKSEVFSEVLSPWWDLKSTFSFVRITQLLKSLLNSSASQLLFAVCFLKCTSCACPENIFSLDFCPVCFNFLACPEHSALCHFWPCIFLIRYNLPEPKL